MRELAEFAYEHRCRLADTKIFALFGFQSIEILRTRCKLNNPRMKQQNKTLSALFFLF